jgi:RNA polymerase sigma-70 factor (ECF subfamily)
MTGMPSEDDAHLVERLRRGSGEAFDAAYERYRPRLFSFLLRLSRHRTLAEDLLDEVWLRLVANAATLRPDTRLGAWLFTVARNLYWSHRRKAVHEVEVGRDLLDLWPAPESWPDPFELAATGELQTRIERALATLPPHHREVLLLVGYGGLTPTEAADVCGITPEALRQRLSRARAALGERIDLPRDPAAQPRRFGT